MVRRPFASICGLDDLDFNEVFFTDVRVPAENLVGPLNGGWGVANGSLGHERTLLWLSYADWLEQLINDFTPGHAAGPGPFATLVMDTMRCALGSIALSWEPPRRAGRAGVSVLKLSAPRRFRMRSGMPSRLPPGPDGLAHPASTGAVRAVR